MKGFDSKAGRGVAVDQPQHDTTRCIANGCPMRGTVDLSNAGRFACSFHAFADGQKWPRITEGLNTHGWLFGLMRDLNKTEMNRGWRQYATEFWKDAEPAMVPSTVEDRPRYLYRMHLSLGFRVGARGTEPTVLKPQGDGQPKRRGNLGELLEAA